MSVCEGSFIEVARDKLIEACDRTLTGIRAHQNKENREYIERRMKEVNKPNLFERIFRLKRKQYTFEEMKKICDEVDAHDMWNLEYPCTKWCKQIGVAHRLMDAAKVADSCMIHVSVEDASWLWW